MDTYNAVLQISEKSLRHHTQETAIMTNPRLKLERQTPRSWNTIGSERLRYDAWNYKTSLKNKGKPSRYRRTFFIDSVRLDDDDIEEKVTTLRKELTTQSHVDHDVKS
jgi:hypothetical protein